MSAQGRILRSTGRVLPAPLVDLHAQAQAALVEAERIREAARAETEAMKEEARRQGHAEGLAAGRDAAAAEALALLTAARTEAERTRLEARDTALVLARRMAERILGRTLALAPEAIGDIVAQALVDSRARTGLVTVRLSPQDFEALSRSQAGLVQAVPAVQIRLVPDQNLATGDCIVETEHGRLDARLATQLDALERALARTLAGAPRAEPKP